MATPSKTSKVDYKALAAKKIRKPGAGKKRYLVYARNKKGKTFFGASGPNTLVLDPENGTEEMPDHIDVWPIQKWEDMNEAYKFLLYGEHDYEWVCVDGLTRINNMALRYVMNQQEERDLDRQPGMVQQRDYGKSGEMMKGMLFNFHNLSVNIVFTAQERQEKKGEFVEDDVDAEGAEVRMVPDLPAGVRASVNAVVSGIGRLYTVRIENPKDPEHMIVQRRLWIGHSEQLDTGFRSKHKLPDMLKNPTIPKLTQLINTGKVVTSRG